MTQVTAARVLGPGELSLAQERVLFYDLLAPEAAFHGVPRLMLIEGDLRIDLFERALNEVVARHEVLRTHYKLEDGAWRATVVPEERIQVSRWVDGVDTDDPSLDTLVAELVSRPFDVSRGPVIRADVLAHSSRRCLFLLDFHHVACDGWSERITINELTELYTAYAQGRPPGLPELPMRYREYATWQRDRLGSPAMAPHHAYWRRQLGPDIPTIRLPFDRPRPAVPSYVGSSFGYELDEQLVADLRAWSAERDLTPYMTMLAAFFLLLHTWTGDDDIVIGSPINNREHQRVHDVIGYFVTRLPLRSIFRAEHTVEEFVRSVGQTVMEAIRHKETTADRWPYPRMDDGIRDSSNYQVMFFYQENPVGVRREFADLVLSNANSHSPGRVESMGLRSPTLGSQLDLGCFIEPVGDRVFGWVEYATDLFDRATMAGFVSAYVAQLRDLVNDSGRTLGQLRRSRSDGQRTLVRELTTAIRSARTSCAVVDEQGQRWTFDDLDELTNGVAGQVDEAVVGPVVALRMHRSVPQVLALVGLLKAGKTVLLLDPRHPDTYVRKAVSTAGAAAVIGTPIPGIPTIPADFAVRRSAPPTGEGTDAALILSTTGTTGDPKLVVVDHESSLVGQTPADAHTTLGPGDVFVVTAPPASARLIGELFWPWLCGAAILLTPAEAVSARDLMTLARRYGGTAISLLPSVLAAVLDDADAASKAATLTLVQTVGEPLPVEVYRRATAVLRADVLNCYGQTEAFAPLFSRPGAALAPGCVTVPLQSEAANGARAVVVDDAGDEVGIGEVGSLLLVGRHIARGYLGSAGDGSSPFQRGSHGERVLVTNHRARRLDDGLLELLGRMDSRVKVSGYSVAPDEVEAVLRGLPGILDARVVVSSAGATPMLHAELVADEVAVREAERMTRGLLPDYMVPASFRRVDAIPRGITGKVGRVESGPTDMRPGAESAAGIAEIFAELLGVAGVEEDADFFQAGGNSLLAIRAISRINERFRTELSLRDFLECRRATAVADRLDPT